MRQRTLSMVFGMAATGLLTGWIPTPPAAAQRVPAARPGHGTTGRVVETMSSGGYTYVQVDDGTKKIWAAAPQFAVAVGNQVSVPEGMPMQDFHSKTLDRTFDVVYFVPEIQVLGAQPAPAHGTGARGEAALGEAPHGMAAHGPIPQDGIHAGMAAAGAPVDLSNIRKADGGQTVAELYANKASLVGKDVAVRGRVVKYTPAVMGKNWVHLQDGTGSGGTNDLTVSTSSTAAVGNTVLVRGKLAADKDLGYGYHYDIIIEDAAVAVE